MQETVAAATFSLSSVFLVMTLAAVAAGVLAAAPGLGVLFLFIATPALIRTMEVSFLRKLQGTPMTPRAKVLEFLLSIAIVVLILVCTYIALFVACTGMATRAGGVVFFALILVGIGSSLWNFWNNIRGRR